MQKSEHERMIDDILDCERGLTDWEINFADSVSQQPPETWTIRQKEVIEKIWNKVH